MKELVLKLLNFVFTDVGLFQKVLIVGFCLN